MEKIYPSFIVTRCAEYATVVQDKTSDLSKFIVFIDGTVFGIGQLGEYAAQNVAYNGHKRENALKFTVWYCSLQSQ